VPDGSLSSLQSGGAYATHSSIRTRQGLYRLRSSTSDAPGLVAVASASATRAYPSASPSCQASSPQRVRTVVPSGLRSVDPGVILWPTRTAVLADGGGSSPASVSIASSPASLVIG